MKATLTRISADALHEYNGSGARRTPGTALSQQQVADLVGITVSRVQQLERKALKKMKAAWLELEGRA
jgi:DNA-directed RNA polymerase sigma subunit (sigma70/sigma32)